MGLEVATYISQLNSANPLFDDFVKEADDHLRLIKTVLQSTFPNLNGAVNSTPAELNLLVGATSLGASPLTTKGDLFAYSTVDVRLPIGANTFVLTADSAEATGMKWAAAAGGGNIGGSITNDQVAIGAIAADDIEGSSGLTYNGTALNITGNLTLTGTVDGIDIATDVAANTSKVSNATHTGQVTGATALSLDVTAVTAQPAAGTPVGTDTMIINDGGVLSEVTLTQLDGFWSGGGGIGGSIADDQIAVGAITANDIEGSSSLRFVGGNLLLGALAEIRFDGGLHERIVSSNVGNGTLTFYQNNQTAINIINNQAISMQRGDLKLGANGVATASFWLDGAITGSPVMTFRQDGTERARIQYVSTGSHFDILNAGNSDVRIGANSVSGIEVDASTTAGDTRLLIWDVDNNIMERVTVGAADSAASGFKVLMIPN